MSAYEYKFVTENSFTVFRTTICDRVNFVNFLFCLLKTYNKVCKREYTEND